MKVESIYHIAILALSKTRILHVIFSPRIAPPPTCRTRGIRCWIAVAQALKAVMLSEGNPVCSWSPRVGHFLIACLNFVSRCPMVLFVGKHHQESLPREAPKSPKLVWSSVDVAPHLESPPGSRKRTENCGSGRVALSGRRMQQYFCVKQPWEGASRHLGHEVVWLDQPPGFVTIGPLDLKLHFLEIQCDDELWCRMM